jgi:hypothetical protein
LIFSDEENCAIKAEVLVVSTRRGSDQRGGTMVVCEVPARKLTERKRGIEAGSAEGGVRRG